MSQGARRRSSCLGRLVKAAVVGGGLVAVSLLAWGLVNVPPPSDPVVRDRLSARDVTILRESQALRRAVGDEVWPDFGRTAIPVQLYNDRFGFVIGMAGPPGWDEVPGQRVDGQPCFRTASPDRSSFAVRVGDTWVGSLSVKDAMDAGVPRGLRAKLGLFGRLVPYRLFVLSTDQYVAALLHEQFHAFQASSNRVRFEAARAAYGPAAAYPWEQEGYRAAWLEEVKLFQSALAATDPAASRELVRQVLGRREARRRRFGLGQAALAFERQGEWLEGLGKYTELESWRRAARGGYRPLDEMRADPQFHAYGGYDGQWRTERMNMKVSLNLHGDLPFYYTGAMQAQLLDALAAGWKKGFLESGRHLEELLAEAVDGTSAFR